MAYESDRPGETPAEQRGAAPHLPSPTIWPVGFAAGVALLLIGLVIGNWPVVAVGAGLSIVFGFLWIRDVTRDVRQAPEPPVAAAPTHELALEDDHVEAEEQTYPKFTRAKLLEGSTLGLGALIGGIITVPVIGFAVAPAFVDQGYDDIDLGPLSEFPEGKWMVTTFRDDKDSPSDVSRRTAYIRNNGFVNSLPSFTIISNRCVHLGCPVQPNGPTDAKKQVTTSTGPVELTPAQPSGFGCPCHGGAYDTEGNRVAGPPVRALDRYRFSVRDGSLWIGNLYSVAKVDGAGGDAVIKGYDNNYDPGVHVDGWEQILYPYNP